MCGRTVVRMIVVVKLFSGFGEGVPPVIRMFCGRSFKFLVMPGTIRGAVKYRVSVRPARGIVPSYSSSSLKGTIVHTVGVTGGAPGMSRGTLDGC